MTKIRSIWSGWERQIRAINSALVSKFGWSVWESLLFCECAIIAGALYGRAFFGTEITDEAFYVSDALGMIHGNLPYAYNNFSYGTGAAFLCVPLLAIYERIVPNCAGIFLYTRLCFLTFRLIALSCSFAILRKHMRRADALLLTGFVMATYSGNILNFSYDTIPYTLAFLSAVTLYDAMEKPEKNRTVILLTLTGFLCGVFIFAHPGYGLAGITFFALILIRSPSGSKIRNAFEFLSGGAAEILVVLIPIGFQAGFARLARGLYLMTHSYPVYAEAAPAVNANQKLATIGQKIIPFAVCYAAGGIAFFLLSSLYARKKGEKQTLCDRLFFATIGAVLACLLRFAPSSGNAAFYGVVGLIACVSVMTLLILYEIPTLFSRLRKGNPNRSDGRDLILWYLGLYPPLYAFVASIVIDTSSKRLAAAAVGLSGAYALLLKRGNRPARALTICAALVSTFLLLRTDLFAVYRDSPLSQLDTRVESGVYAGIYTVSYKARDLPELEEYLNGMVSPEESYAFRDNAPCGYLMMRHGVMCDEATWDLLQYAYHRNGPAALFDYYQRRERIPDKIIYLNIGQYPTLSIDDPAFRYNDFVNAYYELIDQKSLNPMFQDVRVYAYKGGFDGDYDAWIDAYR